MTIDRAFIAHRTPIWVDTRAPLVGVSGTATWQHLLVAQDTGSSIQGAARGDIYWATTRPPPRSADAWAVKAATGCCCPKASPSNQHTSMAS